MKKANASLIGMLIVAVSFSIFAPGIALFLNKHFGAIDTRYYVTALSVIAISLYVVALVYVYRYFKKEKMRGVKMESYLKSISAIAVSTSLWSLFVLVMWWG